MALAETTFQPVEAQLATLRRGAEKILPDEASLSARLERSRAERRPLRVKLGIDPTSSDLTLGHTLALRNLRRFQDFGHHAVLVVGDYTATVGDPTGRSRARPPLTHEQVLANATTYQEQAGKIIDMERAEAVWNSAWLAQLTLRDLIRIGSRVSVKRMLGGEYFGRRMTDADQTVYLHEMFYPLMQGMDSVEIRADVELGGADQEFNCLMGRDLQRLHGQEPQLVVTNPLLLGLSGPEKMSKSVGNYVGVAWPPAEQFRRLMTLDDDRMREYFRLLTDAPLEDVGRRQEAVARRELDPRELKKELATRIVAELNGTDAATVAAEEYERYAGLRRGDAGAELPPGLAEVKVALGPEGARLVELIVRAGLATSNGAAKRLIQQGGVRLRREVVGDASLLLRTGEADGALLEAGRQPPVILRETAA